MRLVISAVLVGAVLLGVTMAGCLGDDFSEPVPVWEPGYSWTFQVETDMQVRASASGADGQTEDSSVVSVSTGTYIEVLNSDATVAGSPAYLAVLRQSVHSVTVDGEQVWPPAEDDDPEAMDVLVAEFCAGGCAMPVWIRKADLAVAYDTDGPFEATLEFPLQPGRTWESEPAIDESPHKVGFRSEVIGRRGIDLADGRMDAILITAKVDPSAAARANEEARKEMPEDVKVTFSVSGVTEDYYAPRALQVVGSDALLTIAVKMTGDGTLEAVSDLKQTSRLIDHTLDVKPPRTLADIKTALPPLPPSDPWPFVIDASTGSIAAQRGAQVSLSVNETASALEDGAVVRWTVQHDSMDGIKTQRHRGNSFVIDTSRPGAYHVFATVHDADRTLRGVASLLVDAYTRAGLTLDDPAGTPLTRTTNTTFAVAPGACTMTLQVDPEVFAHGTYRIANAETAQQGTSMGGTHELTAPVIPGTFDLAWTDDLRAGPLDLGLEVHYGCGADPAEPTASVAKAILMLRQTQDRLPYRVAL